MAVSFRGPRNTGLSPSVSTKCGAHPDLLDTTAPPLLLLLGASQPMAWGAQSQGGWGVAHPCSSTRSRNGPAPSPGPPCAGNTHLGQGQGRCSPEGIKTPWGSAGLAESRATRSSSLLPPGSFPGERRPPSSLQGAPQGSADRAWGTGTASPLPVTRGQWRGIHQGGTPLLLVPGPFLHLCPGSSLGPGWARTSSLDSTTWVWNSERHVRPVCVCLLLHRGPCCAWAAPGTPRPRAPAHRAAGRKQGAQLEHGPWPWHPVGLMLPQDPQSTIPSVQTTVPSGLTSAPQKRDAGFPLKHAGKLRRPGQSPSANTQERRGGRAQGGSRVLRGTGRPWGAGGTWGTGGPPVFLATAWVPRETAAVTGAQGEATEHTGTSHRE